MSFMTDHSIQRRKPARDLTAPLAEKRPMAETAYKGEVVPYCPEAVDELIGLYRRWPRDRT